MERRLRPRGNGGCVDIESHWLCSFVILEIFAPRFNATRKDIYIILLTFRHSHLWVTWETWRNLSAAKRANALSIQFPRLISQSINAAKGKIQFLRLQNNFSDFQWRRNRLWFIEWYAPSICNSNSNSKSSIFFRLKNAIKIIEPIVS